MSRRMSIYSSGQYILTERKINAYKTGMQLKKLVD